VVEVWMDGRCYAVQDGGSRHGLWQDAGHSEREGMESIVWVKGKKDG